jgi:hypothetical protein
LILASYAATAIAFLVIGYAIGRKRDAKVESEIASLTRLFLEHAEAKTKAKTPT